MGKNLLTRRMVEVLLYLHPNAPRPRHIEVPRPAFIRRMHDAGLIDRRTWTLRELPQITAKARDILALIGRDLPEKSAQRPACGEAAVRISRP